MTTVTVNNVQGGAAPSAVSASADSSPTGRTCLLAGAAVIVAIVLMWFAFKDWVNPGRMELQAGYVPFAGVVVAAAALERALEPLSDFFGLPKATTTETSDAATKKTTAANAAADPTQSQDAVQAAANAAADAQSVVDKKKADRAVIFWAIASVCGLGLSGGMGFLLLNSVASTHVNRFLDMVVTGLAIGAGTKPLHDLVTNIQSKASS